jgi:4-hydroxy-3-polyprenylbenzoate decarboxylase
MCAEAATPQGKTFAVGVTGASGSVLAERLVQVLLEEGHTVHLCASKTGRLVIHEELQIEGGARGIFPHLEHPLLIEWGDRNFHAPFASGSAPFDGMAVIPCSLATVAAIAHGFSDNLLRRGAEVMLKERRPLVVVPRESPLSPIHLENLLTVSRAGGTIIPPILTFYQQPGDSVAPQVDFVVSRVLDHLGVANELYPRWGVEA